MTNNILTIDGPSGAGKGTVASIIANKKGWHLLDSGALYRAFALAASNTGIIKDINFNVGISPLCESALQKLAKNLKLRFDDNHKIYIDDKEVSQLLRTDAIASLASKLSTIKIVRTELLQKQRNFAKFPGLVADGRDMGSVVFHNAVYKVFLTASAKERAKRRLKQLHIQGNNGILHKVLAGIKKRDKRDITRKFSPLIAVKDALIIDTTELSINAVVTKIITFMET